MAEHEQFLLKLEEPMVIPKEKIIRWHPEFDVENCKPIEHSELPQPPDVEKATSAQHVLGKIILTMISLNKYCMYVCVMI